MFKDLWPAIFDRLRLAGKLVDPRLAEVTALHRETPAVLHAQLRPKVAAFRERRNNDAAPPVLRALTTSPRAMQAVRNRMARRQAPYEQPQPLQ